MSMTQIDYKPQNKEEQGMVDRLQTILNNAHAEHYNDNGVEIDKAKYLQNAMSMLRREFSSYEFENGKEMSEQLNNMDMVLAVLESGGEPDPKLLQGITRQGGLREFVKHLVEF